MARDRASKGPKRIRVHLSAPGAAPEQVASIWVEETAALKDGRLGVKLLYDYPDLKPAQGWTLEHDGKTYTVERVSGQNLQVAAQASPQSREETSES
jgi:hypothetical protein